MKPRKATGKPREQAPEGNHTARLLGIVDLGHQPGFIYEGKKIDSSWKYEFTYELVNTQMEDGRPFVVSEEVRNNDWEDIKTAKRSTLVTRARALMGADYKDGMDDLSKLLEKECAVTIEHKNGYANVKGQSAVGSLNVELKNIGVKELHNDPYTFSMDEPDMDLWEKFPEFKQNKIKNALNFNETALAKALAEQNEF
jgi:hypothetical protein